VFLILKKSNGCITLTGDNFVDFFAIWGCKIADMAEDLSSRSGALDPLGHTATSQFIEK